MLMLLALTLVLSGPFFVVGALLGAALRPVRWGVGTAVAVGFVLSLGFFLFRYFTGGLSDWSDPTDAFGPTPRELTLGLVVFGLVGWLAEVGAGVGIRRVVRDSRAWARGLPVDEGEAGTWRGGARG